MKPENDKKTLDAIRIGNRAVANAQEENRRHNLPNVYSKNKKLYFELPDGTITTHLPLSKFPKLRRYL